MTDSNLIINPYVFLGVAYDIKDRNLLKKAYYEKSKFLDAKGTETAIKCYNYIKLEMTKEPVIPTTLLPSTRTPMSLTPSSTLFNPESESWNDPVYRQRFLPGDTLNPLEFSKKVKNTVTEMPRYNPDTFDDKCETISVLPFNIVGDCTSSIAEYNGMMMPINNVTSTTNTGHFELPDSILTIPDTVQDQYMTRTEQTRKLAEYEASIKNIEFQSKTFDLGERDLMNSRLQELQRDKEQSQMFIERFITAYPDETRTQYYKGALDRTLYMNERTI
jgi:hypothetical protein